MRLIDADAVKFNFQYGRDDNGILLVPYRDEKKLIEAAKTVDAVPVVRCKDCKHSYEDLDGLCCSYGPSVDCVVSDFHFCANGERKDGGSDA